jgi:hypothetical protein
MAAAQRRLCAPIQLLILDGLKLKILVGFASHIVIRLQTGHLAAVSTFEVALLLKPAKFLVHSLSCLSVRMSSETLIVKRVVIKELKMV